MPVQTRKRPSISSDTKVTSPTANKKARKEESPPKKVTKIATKKNASVPMEVDSKEPKDQFTQVVNEIDRSGKILKAKHLSSAKPVAVKGLEDPKKAPLRKAIVEEVRRLSEPQLFDDDEGQEEPSSLKPQEVKVKVKAEQQRRKAGVKLVRKAVAKEIDSLGEDSVSKVLHPIRSHVAVDIGAGVGKRGGKLSEAQTKVVQKKTLDELVDLVTPTIEHRPSLVKSKLGVKSAKALVEQEVKKAVTVKEIKQLGTSGIKDLLNNVDGGVAVAAPVAAANGKAKKSPRKK